MPSIFDKETGKGIEFKPTPDRCPICHQGITPKSIGTNKIRYEGEGDIYELEVVYRCPRHQCSHAFVARYRQQHVRGRRTDHAYVLVALLPMTIEDVEKSQEINSVSTDYIEIYRQSSAAEKYGLDMIAGGGYRKALEHLIKDYLILQKPDEKAAIERKFLGTCIREDVDDANIRMCAQRAVWLGNDEVHFKRRWASKDIDDLKILLRLVEAWIETSLLTKQYEEEMVEGNPN